MTKYRIRFQDHFMQKHYENLIKNGHHWKTAESKTLKTFKEYDNGSYSVL
jgi:hypothetical protein